MKLTIKQSLFGLACAAALSFPSAKAAGITDPANDFLPSYTGPHNADLDVLSANATFNGSGFTFTSTQAGLDGITPTALYVWGIDRGQGVAGFPRLRPAFCSTLFSSSIRPVPVSFKTSSITPPLQFQM